MQFLLLSNMNVHCIHMALHENSVGSLPQLVEPTRYLVLRVTSGRLRLVKVRYPEPILFFFSLCRLLFLNEENTHSEAAEIFLMLLCWYIKRRPSIIILSSLMTWH